MKRLQVIYAIVMLGLMAAAFSSDVAEARQTDAECVNYAGNLDPRYVGPLGPLPAGSNHAGEYACEFYGIGATQFYTSAHCLAQGYEMVELNGNNYCVWGPHNGRWLASIIHDVGTPPPPDDIEFPIPMLHGGEIATSNPSHCVNDTNFAQVLGEWRGRTVCEIDLPPMPQDQCPAATPSQHGRARVYPTGFANPSATTITTPAGTQFCVFGYHDAHYGNPLRFWFDSGWRAIRIQERVTTGTLCILKYDDRNNSGSRQGNEALLEGWQFQLSRASGHHVGSYQTRGDGRICIENLEPGSYTITEPAVEGWLNTQPGVMPGQDATRSVDLEVGETVTVEFGNCQMNFSRRGRTRCMPTFGRPDPVRPRPGRPASPVQAEPDRTRPDGGHRGGR